MHFGNFERNAMQRICIFAILNKIFGGGGRNRTGVDGFAGLSGFQCLWGLQPISLTFSDNSPTLGVKHELKGLESRLGNILSARPLPMGGVYPQEGFSAGT